MPWKVNTEEFLTSIKQKWVGDKDCPLCKSNEWKMGDILSLIMVTDGKLVLGGATMPAVPLVCLGCGYTMLFNPIVTGLFMSDEED